MPSRRSLCLSFVATTLTSACGRLGLSGEPRRYPLDPTPEAAADRAVRDLAHLVTPRDYADFGFHAFSEVAIARRGDPLAIFYLPVDRLRIYAPEAPVESLLVPSGQTLYSVVVQAAVRSSVVVTQEANGYRPAEMGEAPVMRAISTYHDPRAGSEFVVRAPGLSVVMLGRRRAGAIFFVPLFAQPDLGFPVGMEQPAAAVVAQLVPLARKANGKPA